MPHLDLMSAIIFLQNLQLLHEKFGRNNDLPFRAIIDEKRLWSSVMWMPQKMSIYDYRAVCPVDYFYIGGYERRLVLGFYSDEEHIEAILRL